MEGNSMTNGEKIRAEFEKAYRFFRIKESSFNIFETGYRAALSTRADVKQDLGEADSTNAQGLAKESRNAASPAKYKAEERGLEIKDLVKHEFDTSDYITLNDGIRRVYEPNGNLKAENDRMRGEILNLSNPTPLQSAEAAKLCLLLDEETQNIITDKFDGLFWKWIDTEIFCLGIVCSKTKHPNDDFLQGFSEAVSSMNINTLKFRKRLAPLVEKEVSGVRRGESAGFTEAELVGIISKFCEYDKPDKYDIISISSAITALKQCGALRVKE